MNKFWIFITVVWLIFGAFYGLIMDDTATMVGGFIMSFLASKEFDGKSKD